MCVCQLNKSPCGGALLCGKPAASRYSPLARRCVSIFLITSGSSMQAMTFILPPQTLQVSMSISNTRFKRCAQLIAAWRATGVASSGLGALALFPRPRRAGVTSARCWLLGANTPWARQRYCNSPQILMNTSSRYQVSPNWPCLFFSFRAYSGPIRLHHCLMDSYETAIPRSASRSSTSRKLRQKR